MRRGHGVPSHLTAVTSIMKNMKKNVLVLLWSSTVASGRDFLAGFASLARRRADWQLHLRIAKRTVEPNVLRVIRAGGYSGIVVDEDTYLSLPDGAVPDTTAVVVFGTYDPNAPANVAYVQNDNAAIARFGGDYLLSLGRFRAFGFVPTEDEHGWSRLRAAAFAEAVRTDGRDAFVFDPNDRALPLKAWLRALPKPAAVMAACDTTALEVVEACKRARLAVPGQVSVLGVDNDELLCEFDSPTVSSVLPRHDVVGRLAAKTLARMLRGRKWKGPRCAICDEQTVVERESTAFVTPAAHLVSAALHFIRQNATRAVTADDVARHLGVSRSLVDLRFRQFQGTTVRETILRTRLEEVKRRLLATNLSAAKVARVCGFTDIPHLQVVFKRRFGQPMGQWRKAYGPC